MERWCEEEEDACEVVLVVKAVGREKRWLIEEDGLLCLGILFFLMTPKLTTATRSRLRVTQPRSDPSRALSPSAATPSPPVIQTHASAFSWLASCFIIISLTATTLRFLFVSYHLPYIKETEKDKVSDCLYVWISVSFSAFAQIETLPVIDAGQSRNGWVFKEKAGKLRGGWVVE